MDCDYDPSTSTQQELMETSKGKKKRKRKSKFAQAVGKPKPKYDPNDKKYEEYFEEYYKLDCEDIIGDIPCRFKYRKVVPNDFGLSTEEILLAKERELNKWCSLKKTVQIRPDNVEKYDQIAYKKKALNINLKRKILPSLFGGSSEEDEVNSKHGNIEKERGEAGENIKMKVENDATGAKISFDNSLESSVKESEHTNGDKSSIKNTEKKAKTKNEGVTSPENVNNVNVAKEGGIRDFKDNVGADVANKSKKKTSGVKNEGGKINNNKKHTKSKQKRKRSEVNKDKADVPRKRFKKGKVYSDKAKEVAISDARLAAYGINPKKFKNKLKFGKT